MRAQEFISESKTASAEAVWNYVKRIHPAEQQGGGFLEQLIRQYPQYRLQTVPVASLIIHDQESDDPDEEPEEDPYGRVQVVDPEYAGEVSVHNLDRNPIVIDAQGHILDGNHRAWAAAELLGRDTIQAWVPVKSVTEDAFNGINVSLEIQKDDEYVDDEDYDNQVIYVTASSNGRELGHVLFAFDGEYLMPQDLEVDERYRGQGIAATMYDYVKSRGYKIRRSGQQTPAGAGFWDRHRPEKNLWEQQELNEIGDTRPEYTRPDKQKSGKHKFTTRFTGARGKQRQVDVYFMYDYNTLEIDFKVDGRVNSYVTGGGDAVLILSAVRHIVEQELPKILKRIPRLKQVRFRSYAEEQSRVSLYLNRAVPMVSRILGPDWRYYGDFMTMGDSHWFYWQHRTVTGMDRVRVHGREPQEQPDEPYDVGETERFRQAWEKKQQQGVAEGKVKLYTNPGYFGAEVDDTGFDSLPAVNIPTNQLVGFEPDDKMNQPKSKANVEKIVADLKKGDKLPPILVRKYKNGYQVLDGHHRFWAYKLLGVKSIPSRIVPDSDIEEIGKQGVAASTK